jgi:hypothetical protein
MPMKLAVREMLPPNRRIWAFRYSRSNSSRASRSGRAMIRSAPIAPALPPLGCSACCQHLGGDHLARLARGQDQHALDVVAQLADVAGPGLDLQGGQGVLAQSATRMPVASRSLDEVADQLGDVLATLRQARHPHRHHVQAVEQVLAEAPAAISSRSSREVDEITRTSTWTSLSPPTRRKRCSTRTRRMRLWVSRGMSATSSR